MSNETYDERGRRLRWLLLDCWMVLLPVGYTIACVIMAVYGSQPGQMERGFFILFPLLSVCWLTIIWLLFLSGRVYDKQPRRQWAWGLSIVLLGPYGSSVWYFACLRKRMPPLVPRGERDFPFGDRKPGVTTRWLTFLVVWSQESIHAAFWILGIACVLYGPEARVLLVIHLILWTATSPPTVAAIVLYARVQRRQAGWSWRQIGNGAASLLFPPYGLLYYLWITGPQAPGKL